jgi:hypothetical protein
MMHGVAGRAGDAVLVVRGPGKLALLRIGFVAGQAALCNFLRPGPLEDEYLTFIAASVNVQRSRAVA